MGGGGTFSVFKNGVFSQDAHMGKHHRDVRLSYAVSVSSSVRRTSRNSFQPLTPNLKTPIVVWVIVSCPAIADWKITSRLMTGIYMSLTLLSSFSFCCREGSRSNHLHRNRDASGDEHVQPYGQGWPDRPRGQQPNQSPLPSHSCPGHHHDHSKGTAH